MIREGETVFGTLWSFIKAFGHHNHMIPEMIDQEGWKLNYKRLGIQCKNMQICICTEPG